MANPKKATQYHHGDLRRALLDAGEAELSERGLAGFSLRRVAARVGVSHAAPAHHFGDAAGLIEMLAERGFQRLLACMQARQAGAPPDPFEQLMASGLGYMDFALANPALFRLVFRLPQKPAETSGLKAAGDAAFLHLAQAVAALRGEAPLADPEATAEVMACWTRVHGLADLVISGYIDLPEAAQGAEDREALFRRVFNADLRPRGAGPERPAP